MRVCNVVAARPNFMKMAPVVLELRGAGVDQFLVHTGQHYDANMSDVFFEELGMPRPDVHLGVGSGSHAAQTAAVLVGVRGDLPGAQARPRRRRPATSTRRSPPRSPPPSSASPSPTSRPGSARSTATMPEEINRVLTDHLSDLLFVTEDDAVENLRREGIAATTASTSSATAWSTASSRHVEAALGAVALGAVRARTVGLRPPDAAPALERRRRPDPPRPHDGDQPGLRAAARSSSRSTRGPATGSAARGSRRRRASAWPSRCRTWRSSG